MSVLRLRCQASERLQRAEDEVKQERRLLDARAAGHEPDFLELDDWAEDAQGENKEYLENQFGQVCFTQRNGSNRLKAPDSGRFSRLSLGRKSVTHGAEGSHGAWQGPQRSMASEPHLGSSWGASPPNTWPQTPIPGAASKGEVDEEAQIAPRGSNESGFSAHSAGHSAHPSGNQRAHTSMRSRLRGSSVHSKDPTKSPPTVKEVLGWLQQRFTGSTGNKPAHEPPHITRVPSSGSGHAQSSRHPAEPEAASMPEVKKPPSLRLVESSDSPPTLAHRGSSSPSRAAFGSPAVFGSPFCSPRALHPTQHTRPPVPPPLPPAAQYSGALQQLRLRASAPSEQVNAVGGYGGSSAPTSPMSHASSPVAHASTSPSGRKGKLGQAQQHASMDSGDSSTNRGHAAARRSGRLGRSLEMPNHAPPIQPQLRKRLSVMSDRGSGNFAEALSDCLL